MVELKSSLKKVKGLGSAKSGVHHWIVQRLTAILLIPLSVWFISKVLSLVGASQQEFQAWVLVPANAVLLISFVLMLFYHGYLGLQVVIEDYVHQESYKVSLLILSQSVMGFMALLSIFSVLKIAL